MYNRIVHWIEAYQTTTSDEPRLIATIDTGYNRLLSVSSVNDEDIWARGENEIMKLINLEGKLLM
jgi:hypothetical protein